MAKWFKCLPHKHEDLSLIPQNPHEKQGVVAHMGHLGAREVGQDT